MCLLLLLTLIIKWVRTSLPENSITLVFTLPVSRNLLLLLRLFYLLSFSKKKNFYTGEIKRNKSNHIIKEEDSKIAYVTLVCSISFYFTLFDF